MDFLHGKFDMLPAGLSLQDLGNEQLNCQIDNEQKM